jgi:hypothetical protein
MRFLILVLWAFWSLLAQSGSEATEAGQPLPPDAGWPREYTDGTAKLVLNQPQVDSWKGFQDLTARLATELTPKAGEATVYGVLSISSETVVDMETRTVAFKDFRVAEVRYSSAKDEAEEKNWIDLTRKLLPTYPTSIALDRVLAHMDTAPTNVRETEVTLDPPPILVSQQPAVLVILDGQPIPIDVEKTKLQKVVNTNWDLFRDTKDDRFYLRDDKVWYSAANLTGWQPVKKLPEEFSNLPDTEQYKDIKETIAKPQKPSGPKLIIVAYKPSELILIDGEPKYQPVVGSELMWIVNSESDLFFHTTSRQFYFLTSGRWFSSAELKSNAWTAATTALPEEFKKIPADHPRAHVLAAVPGTRQAQEAVISASIPQRATIDRESAKAEVQYVGEPKFEPIEKTGVSYAVNTPNDVLEFNGSYYLCLDGVWLISTSANGPWQPAETIPQEIYSIPPSSPKHNVTYVTVQESTPTTVTYSYTSGYTGMYIGYGVAMWGTGYYYPPYYGWGYYPYPVYWPAAYYTYGAAAWYNPVTGGYGRGSAVYGPYGGYARAAAYNPRTGGYAWGRSAWGPYGAAASGGFYNPRTGSWGGSYRASNGYQSWGQSVVGRGDRWARTASYSDSRGSVGAIKTSEGGRGVVARGDDGRGFAARSGSGDVYAGRDGNVYKRDQSGNWYRNSGSGSWDSVDRPTPSANQQARASERQAGRSGAGGQVSSTSAERRAGASDRGSVGSSGTNRSTVDGLNRDASARSRGNSNTQRSSSARSSGMSGYGGGGFSRRGGGFGRRR